MSLRVYYHQNFNIDLGLLRFVHPFNGLKFKKVFDEIKNTKGLEISTPKNPVSNEIIEDFVDSLQIHLLKKKGYILRALEAPKIPFIPFSWIDKKILLPMRWGVSATIEAAEFALSGHNCWNLAGGYHHASKASSEGFCIYNDIGIAVEQLKKKSLFNEDEKILIIDIDAHHGNGNAYVYMEDSSVTILDIYNNDIYPNNAYTKERLDINIPLQAGIAGEDYLAKLKKGLDKISGEYKLAFVIAGTDTLKSDPLGGLSLSIEECVKRDVMVAQSLIKHNIPFVFLGGGGYSSDSTRAITASIKQLVEEL